MKPTVLHLEAEEEALDAAEWYEKKRPGLGKAFRLDLETALHRLQTNPELYGVDLEPFRACPLHRFPYTLYYLNLPHEIWIVAVAHQNRRPGYWQRRVNRP